MRFTGRNLQLVEWGLELALNELHNLRATCPNVIEYADDIVEIEVVEGEFITLLERVRASPDLVPREDQP